MKPAIKRAIAISLQSGLPTLVWGSPGAGKTSYFQNLAKEVLKLPIETIIASIREPSDFGGLPVIREQGVELEAPAWAKRLLKAKKGILFIDEISTAPPAVQAALLRVVHEGVVGDLALPPDIYKVAAANPPEQAAGGWVLSPPLANRFVHFEWPTDANVWSDGMLAGWDKEKDMPRLPADWTKHIRDKQALVSAYVRTRPNKISVLPKQENEAGKAWPSPRTWDYAARLLAAVEACGAGEDERILTLAGAIGHAQAGEFLVWNDELDLQNPMDLLDKPESYRHPDRSDKVYATLSALISAALDNLNQKTWSAAWKVLGLAAKAGSADIAAFAARALAENMQADFKMPTKDIHAFAPILQAAKIL